MAYRMSPRVECLIVKDQQGILWHHYQRAPDAGARNLGPIIGWLGDEYRDRWLRMGLVEEITVIDFGKVIAHGAPQNVQDNQAVIEAYLGVDDGAA